MAAVSGDAIFNYQCKWSRTCVSEAFPPWAVSVLPGNAGAHWAMGAPLGRRGGNAGHRVSSPLNSPCVKEEIISVCAHLSQSLSG